MGLTGNICEVVAGLLSLRSAWPKAQIHAEPCHEPYAAISTSGYSRSSLGGAVGPHGPLSPTFLCDSGSWLCFQATPQRAGGGIREPRPPQAGKPPLELTGFSGSQLGLGVFCGHWLAGMWLAEPSRRAADLACCEMGREWRSCSAEGFGHERWKM